MKVTRFPKDPGPAGWNEILPAPAPAERLRERTDADFLIIGGGFAGLAATRRLAQLHPEARIVLLEARRVGEGPAGRNSGFMIDLPHDLASDDYGGALESDLAQTRANRAGIDFAAAMAGDYGLDEEAFTRSGKINAAATDKGHRHNVEFARHLSEMGEPHEMFGAARMREMTGSDYYISGLFTPGTAMIQPALFVRGVARGFRSSRVRLYEDSPVTGLERAGNWLATTPRGAVSAQKVILAVNGHANSFGFFKGRLLHVFTYASMTRALTPDEVAGLGGAARWGVTPADPMGTTVRRISGTGGDRIVIRNRFTCDPSMEVSAARIARTGRDHDRAFAARFPMLGSVGMEYRWGGRLCRSRNGVPAMGELDEGLFAACCQNGLGAAKGTMLGMVTAELAAGRRSALLDEVLALDPPKPLPPAPLTFLGANALVRWGEMKAGREM